MSLAALIRSMAEAGAPAEAIALAVEAIETRDQAVADQRAKARDRKRAQRDRERDSHVTVTGQQRDILPETKVSPRPPSKTQTILTPSPPKGGSVPMLSSFPAFWLAYPRKEAKGAAEKAYAKALALIGGPDPPAVLLAALERDKVRWTDAQFIPHPSTWLNQRRWEDEPEPGNGTQRPRTDRRSADYADRMLVVGTALAAAVEQSSRRS